MRRWRSGRARRARPRSGWGPHHTALVMVGTTQGADRQFRASPRAPPSHHQRRVVAPSRPTALPARRRCARRATARSADQHRRPSPSPVAHRRHPSRRASSSRRRATGRAGPRPSPVSAVAPRVAVAFAEQQPERPTNSSARCPSPASPSRSPSRCCWPRWRTRLRADTRVRGVLGRLVRPSSRLHFARRSVL